MPRSIPSRTLPALLSVLLLTAVSAGVRQVAAQQRAAATAGIERPAGEAETSEPDDPTQLPAPLEGIRSNARDLEHEGWLKLDEVNFQPGGGIFGSQDAVVWTLRAQRPITARHLEVILEKFVDVRFYDTRRDRKALLHQTLLVHPTRIRLGAVDGVILQPGDYVDVWFHLRETDIRRLRSLKADYVELGKRPSRVSR